MRDKDGCLAVLHSIRCRPDLRPKAFCWAGRRGPPEAEARRARWRRMILHSCSVRVRSGRCLRPTTNRTPPVILEVRREISQAAIDVQQRVREAPPLSMDFLAHSGNN